MSLDFVLGIDNVNHKEKYSFLRHISNSISLSSERFVVYHSDNGLFMQKTVREVGLSEKIGKIILITTIVVPIFAFIARLTYLYLNKVNVMCTDNCFTQKQFEEICTVPEKIQAVIRKYGRCVNMSESISLSRWHQPPSKISMNENTREWHIYKNGYYILEVPRDGNCAFHALGIGIAINSPNDDIVHTYQTLRHDIIKKMEAILDDPDSDDDSGNMLRQTIKFCGEELQEKKCTTKSYFEFMKTDCFFADDAVLSTYAMSHIDTTNLIRCCELRDRYSGNIEIRPQTLCEYNEDVNNNIYLLWENGLVTQQHYNLIVPVNWVDHRKFGLN
ncbi:hypothetical protein N9N03_02475 [Chlamydiia bacterium]|nr:hypothetical protein [Chlamydiia bacterium]